jgi:hypothetical protein
LVWLRLLHERPGTNLQPYEVSHRDAVLDYLAHLEPFRDGWVRFEMDRAGIERREAEAEELVELRAKVMLLQGKYDRLQALLDEAFTAITDGQVDADWEGWCARVVRVLETIKVTP